MRARKIGAPMGPARLPAIAELGHLGNRFEPANLTFLLTSVSASLRSKTREIDRRLLPTRANWRIHPHLRTVLSSTPIATASAS